ncbi:MAG: glycosyltransferase/methyltransferase [Candidatus Riflebacteria bacterium HGW-Riflebacteria-2]|nr:MAG: glycosyltransferase/methyltransferase [Candidatus Riflebacteria bacterium HGW-Riflebacteria-2]
MGLEATTKNQYRLLVFIVAYNARSSLEKVFARIPKEVYEYDYEILLIDDSSADDTFQIAKKYQGENRTLNLTVLYNPTNQGYGGNQKLGYRYAIDNNYDVVVLLHGDGQYPPEMIEPITEPIISGEADAVFGSRMLKKWGALRGGMPLYKFIGNKILTFFQNKLLNTSLSEFHSGFRAYSVESLKKIPFERNTNDFHFDTEIIIQLLHAQLKIKEIPIPTYYGDEICYVNGMKYAFDVAKTTILFRLHKMSLAYQLNFDFNLSDNCYYELKESYPSSHSYALESIMNKAKVLDIGCGTGAFLDLLLAKKSVDAYGIDYYDLPPSRTSKIKFIKANLEDPEQIPCLEEFDSILMLDIIEHLSNPEIFLDRIRAQSKLKKPQIIATTGNIGFFVMRIQLLFNNFNYGKQGILDKTHKRLFTFHTFKRLFEQCGYIVTKMEGIPAPFPKAIGKNALSALLININSFLIKMNMGLFSYQIYIEAKPTPTVNELLKLSLRESGMKRQKPSTSSIAK